MQTDTDYADIDIDTDTDTDTDIISVKVYYLKPPLTEGRQYQVKGARK